MWLLAFRALVHINLIKHMFEDFAHTITGDDQLSFGFAHGSLLRTRHGLCALRGLAGGVLVEGHGDQILYRLHRFENRIC